MGLCLLVTQTCLAFRTGCAKLPSPGFVENSGDGLWWMQSSTQLGSSELFLVRLQSTMNKRPGVQKLLSAYSTRESFAVSSVSFHLAGHNKESSAMLHLRVLGHMDGKGHPWSLSPSVPRVTNQGS